MTPLTRFNPSELVNAALTGPCDGCNTPDALYMATTHERYCVRCHTRMVLYEGAENHLYALLEPAFKAWATHTRQLLSKQEISELLDFVTGRFRTFLERSAQEEVAVSTRSRTDWTV